jgi:hypothetical protein
MSLMAFHCHETMAEVDCEVQLGTVPGLRIDPTCFYEEMTTEIYLPCEVVGAEMVTRVLQRMVFVHYVSSWGMVTEIADEVLCTVGHSEIDPDVMVARVLLT